MPEKKSRRSLLKGLAAAPVLPVVLDAQQQPVSGMAAQADVLTQLVRTRYGEYLSAAEMDEIRTGVERMLRNAETISRVKIGNSDGPDYLFHPHES
jgi:hypothetical protein